jgi:hypothetical protein
VSGLHQLDIRMESGFGLILQPPFPGQIVFAAIPIQGKPYQGHLSQATGASRTVDPRDILILIDFLASFFNLPRILKF